ncbi:MAG: glucose-1-phosphate thymidylyltransferase [Patescibacteria group bacterium]
MKALIAAGGRATRLRPLTHTTNKHLIPLANEPMIFNAIGKVVEIGVKDVFINVNPGEMEIQKYVGDGARWGINIRYIEQTGGPLGLAHIVKNAESYIGNEKFIFYLGDNLVLGSLKPLYDKFETENLDALFAFAEVKDPRGFGVPEMIDGRLMRIVEKPANPACNLAQTGIYFYTPKIFDAVKNIAPSVRGEYEISDANTYLIRKGANVGWLKTEGWWKDTGKPEDLLEGNQLLLSEKAAREESENLAEVEPGVSIHGKVWIGEGTKILGKTRIRGPVILGKDCVIEDAYIGPHTSIGNGARVRKAEIEHSIIFDRVDINCGARIIDSIVGYNASIAAAEETMPRGHRLIIGDNTVIEL